MIPWDMNLSQQALYHPCGFGRNTIDFPISNRLLGDEAFVAQYKALFTTMLDGPASKSQLHSKLDQAVALLGPLLTTDEAQMLRDEITLRTDYFADYLPGLITCPESTD